MPRESQIWALSRRIEETSEHILLSERYATVDECICQKQVLQELKSHPLYPLLSNSSHSVCNRALCHLLNCEREFALRKAYDDSRFVQAELTQRRQQLDSLDAGASSDMDRAYLRCQPRIRQSLFARIEFLTEMKKDFFADVDRLEAEMAAIAL
nr:hypothetical protein CFP56_09861 [Quercus suber]